MISRVVLPVLFLFSFAENLTAQNQITVSGKVVEDSTRHAVPFVNILLSANRTGTVSDINGKFTLEIDSLIPSDSIIFSVIGYETKIISAGNFSAALENTIALTKRIYEIPSVTIDGLSSRQIIEKAIRKIPDIVMADTFYLNAFYRQYHEENNKYVRLIEATVTIENRVTKNKYLLKADERVSINQIRRSDNRERNNEEHGDHLMELLEVNPVYHTTGTMLNLKALDLYRFYFDTTYTTDSVFHIYYYSTDRSGERFDRGEIFINENNFSILKFTREEIKNTHANRNRLYNSMAPYRWDFLSSKLVAEYRMINGKMFPASLFKTYTHELYDNKVNTKEFLVTENFELTILNESLPGQLPQKKSFSVFLNLYHRKYSYDISFWENYSLPGSYFKKLQNVKNDLEKKKTLGEQFMQNGNK